MEWSNMWTLIIIFVFLLIIYWYASIPKNLPPGPTGLPFLGCAVSAGLTLFKAFNHFGKKYGDIFHVYLGCQLVIVLNDFEVIKEAFVKQGDIFAGRPKIGPNLGFYNDYFGGVVLRDGKYWKEHRRFLLRCFKDYGVGKSTLEPPILDEVHHFIKEIEAHQGTPFNIQKLLMTSTSNNVQILITGKRADYSNPAMHSVIKAIKDCEDLISLANCLVLFPWSRHFLRLAFPNSFKKGSNHQKEFATFVTTAMSDVKKEFAFGQSDNYFQSYLNEKEKRLIKNDKDNIFTDEAIINNTRDFLFAGTDTTANSILWLIVYVTAFPEIQIKVQKEIDQIIGRDREPTYNDRLNTPYVEATILETQRFASVAGHSVPRRTVQSTTLRGYNIPENTIIFPNLWAVHHDPKLWGDPENFRPERFLNADGKCVKPEYLIPFSIGKRICPGELLARMELYLYFVGLLQRFTFVPSNGVMPSLEPIIRFSLGPKSDLICAKPREN